MTSLALYQALTSLQVDENLARQAAEEGSNISMEKEIAEIRAELRMMRWMMGAILAFLLGLSAGMVSLLLQT